MSTKAPELRGSRLRGKRRKRADEALSSDTAERLRIGELQVGTVGTWIIAVRDKQITLGSCILLPLRPVTDLADLTDREHRDLGRTYRSFRSLLMNTWQPTRFNYVVSGQHDGDHLHIHAFPRYESNREFAERVWMDQNWPKFLTFPEIVSEPEWQLLAIRDQLRSLGKSRRIVRQSLLGVPK